MTSLYLDRTWFHIQSQVMVDGVGDDSDPELAADSRYAELKRKYTQVCCTAVAVCCCI
jgi:hypothetical protein